MNMNVIHEIKLKPVPRVAPVSTSPVWNQFRMDLQHFSVGFEVAPFPCSSVPVKCERAQVLLCNAVISRKAAIANQQSVYDRS